MERVYVLENSEFKVANEGDKKVIFGKLRLKNSEGAWEIELVRGKEVCNNIPYDFLNPLQSAFFYGYRGGNVLVASPTSSGKTLIAYLFMQKHKGLKVYTAPTKALVYEKHKEFSGDYYKGEKVEVRTGDKIFEGYKEVTGEVLLCTYEYLAMALRNKSAWTEGIGCIVIDEVHQVLVRPVVEEIIIYCLDRKIPILALSATVPNEKEMAKWIDASLLLESQWRPVKLERQIVKLSDFEPIKISGKIRNVDKIVLRLLRVLFEFWKDKEKEKVILFVPAKKLGWRILELAEELGMEIVNENVPFEKRAKQQMKLFNSNKKIKIAFHNGDLMLEERKKIEDSFRNGDLNVLIATTTLAYGMNLPADKVIVYIDVLKGHVFPNNLDIIQMEGRAGRFGIRDKGSSILVLSDEVVKKFGEEKYVKEFEEFLSDRSNITGDKRKIEEYFYLLLLTAIDYNKERYMDFVRKTLNYSSYGENKILEKFKYLVVNNHVKIAKHEGTNKLDLELTRKGKICLQQNIIPLDFDEYLLRQKFIIEELKGKYKENKEQINWEYRKLLPVIIRPLISVEFQRTFKDYLDYDVKSFKMYSKHIKEIYDGYLDTCKDILECRVSKKKFDTEKGKVYIDFWITKDGTEQFMFYLEGYLLYYPQVKNVFGEVLRLKDEAVYFLRKLFALKKEGYFKGNYMDILMLAHAVKYGVSLDYASIAGINGIGHIRANVIKEVLKEKNLEVPSLGDEIEKLLCLLDSSDKWLREFEHILRDKRDLAPEDAVREAKRILNTLEKQAKAKGVLLDEMILREFCILKKGLRFATARKEELLECFNEVRNKLKVLTKQESSI